MASPLTRRHSELKAVRGRGSEVQSHLAARRYLRALEDELSIVQDLVRQACRNIDADGGRDFRRFLRHSDQAQQRLHRVIKKLKHPAFDGKKEL